MSPTLQIAIVVIGIAGVVGVIALVHAFTHAPELDPQDQRGLGDDEADELRVVQSIHNRSNK